MLAISVTQMGALQEHAQLGFETEMIEHSRQFSPTLCAVLGEERTRLAVRAAINRARGHRLRLRGPIRLFIELSFLCGSAFDTDPQFGPLADALSLDEPEMARAEHLYRAITAYQEAVPGPDDQNLRQALVYLRHLSRERLPMAGGVIEEMRMAYPAKARWVGDEGLRALSIAAVAEARRVGFNARRQAELLAMLMFIFGHGCAMDPLYPWISATLNDPQITDPAARAERLERKAMTWLDHALDELTAPRDRT